VQNRRERPIKPVLTRATIIDAALQIMNTEGLSKVTMRRVATVLDTGHASLYVYVRDAEDLHVQLLDALLAPVVEATPPAGTWRDRIKTLLVDYHGILNARPEIARMALSTQPNGPHYLALVEAILSLLHEGGASDQAAAWGVDLLLLYPTAVAVEHSEPRPVRHRSGNIDSIRAALAEVDATRAPHTARLRHLLVSGSPGARADWALDVLLDGILNADSPSTAEEDQ
jgi:AcrR family transcriptional regulator